MARVLTRSDEDERGGVVVVFASCPRPPLVGWKGGGGEGSKRRQVLGPPSSFPSLSIRRTSPMPDLCGTVPSPANSPTIGGFRAISPEDSAHKGRAPDTQTAAAEEEEERLLPFPFPFPFPFPCLTTASPPLPSRSYASHSNGNAQVALPSPLLSVPLSPPLSSAFPFPFSRHLQTLLGSETW